MILNSELFAIRPALAEEGSLAAEHESPADGAGHATEASAEHGEHTEQTTSAHGGHEGIPWHALTPQFINFGIFVVLLVVLLRKKVSSLFQSRAEQFNQALVKAEQAKHEAEQKRHEISTRLERLSSSSGEDAKRAATDIEELRNKIVNDAKEAAARIKSEAQRTVQSEFLRARTQLNEELAKTAIEMARGQLRDKMADKDQTRLQSEFVEKVQAVPQ